jgi:hypothetical protein
MTSMEKGIKAVSPDLRAISLSPVLQRLGMPLRSIANGPGKRHQASRWYRIARLSRLLAA